MEFTGILQTRDVPKELGSREAVLVVGPIQEGYCQMVSNMLTEEGLHVLPE